MTQPTCSGVKADGAPCGAPALRGRDRCFGHSTEPEDVARRDAARKAGGRARGAQLSAPRGVPDPLPTWWSLDSMTDARGAYAWLVQGVVAGSIEPRACNAIVGALGGLHKALESDHEARIATLERMVLGVES